MYVHKGLVMGLVMIAKPGGAMAPMAMPPRRRRRPSALTRATRAG